MRKKPDSTIILAISGHFFKSYINIFHKTKVQTVILRILIGSKAVIVQYGTLSHPDLYTLI